MDQWDVGIIAWFNQFSRRSYMLDALVYDVAYLNLVKGIPFVLVLAWFWLAPGPSRERNRQIVFATVLAALMAVSLGQLLANALPMRLRPMARTDISFVLPYTARSNLLRDASAFPSDTAMLFSSLATGICFASLPLGLALHAFAATLIGLPRIYVGLHHPTDLIAGAALGILVALLLVNGPIRRRIAAWPLRMADAYPVGFSLVALLFAMQMATMFDDARTVLRDTRMMARLAWCTVSGEHDCSRSAVAPGPGPEERLEGAPREPKPPAGRAAGAGGDPR